MEIYFHGNALIAEKILLDLCSRGCRLAEPGEFTRRAFLNGKLDLCQAEAVADLIHSGSERAIRVAQNQLGGVLSGKIAAISKKLLEILAKTEIEIDFADDGIGGMELFLPDISLQMEKIHGEIESLICSHRFRAAIDGGIVAVILGEPNVGKSSLFNLLLGEDRAIVSEIAGTTRDMISEKIFIGRDALKIYDTAGLRGGELCDIERIGMEKAVAKSMAAELFLIVVDASSEKTPKIRPEISNLLSGDNAILVINKIDLGKKCDLENFLPHIDRIEISAVNANCAAALKKKIQGVISAGEIFGHAVDVAVNCRHVEILRRANACISAAMESIHSGRGAEIIASDLRQSLEILGEIVGAFNCERVLDAVFANFCVGK
jgi:tRNA modification GTPase